MTRKQKVSKEQDPAYRPYERDDNRKKKRNSFGKLNSFTWTPTEESLYVEFLKNNKNLFSDVKERKKSKVFVAMSHYLKKRGPDQCRSHHQKMSIKYGNIDSIIEKVTEEKINRTIGNSQDQNLTNQLQMTQTENVPETQILMEQDAKCEEKEQSLEIMGLQMSSSSEEFILWEYLNEDAWIDG